MNEDGLTPNGKAQVARVKMDAQADARAIRDLLFPADEVA